MLVPVSPEDNYEGFWLGIVHAIPNNHSVVVQWFELRNRDCLRAFNKALAAQKPGGVETSEPKPEATSGDVEMTEKVGSTPASTEVNPMDVEKSDSSVASEQPKEGGEPASSEVSSQVATQTTPAPTFHPKVLEDNDNPNVRWYEKSQIFDAIPVDTVYCGVDLMNVFEFHPDVGLWRLPNALQVMERVQQYDEMEDTQKPVDPNAGVTQPAATADIQEPPPVAQVETQEPLSPQVYQQTTQPSADTQMQTTKQPEPVVTSEQPETEKEDIQMAEPEGQTHTHLEPVIPSEQDASGPTAEQTLGE